MTLSRASLNGSDHDTSQPYSRPVKRAKTDLAASDAVNTEENGYLVRRHPLGVRPSGNAFTSPINLKANCGMFRTLPDEMIVDFLERLQVPHLLRLGSTCKALHAFTRNEELWRALFIE